VPGLYFIGLVQPLGAIMPISERQSELAPDHLQGRYALPEPAEMDAEIDRHRKAVAKRYVASKRHTIQVDFDDYMRVLRRERDAGAQRITTAQAASPRVAA
jgi:dimethylaniline monooxygenase (N-oxide forming)